MNKQEGSNLPFTIQRKLRNQKILILLVCGFLKEQICKQMHLSLRQLNRIIVEADTDAEQWYKSLPRQNMIQIFRYNSERIFQEIQRLEFIRNKTDDSEKEFEMTKVVINTYLQYTKMIAEGPSFTRQKEVIEQAEKFLEEK